MSVRTDAERVTSPEDVTDSISELAWHFGPNGFFGDCYQELSLTDYRTLEAVVREDASCRECAMHSLVDALGFTKGGVTRIVNRLEKRELLYRCRRADDGRICCVVPTEQGRSLAGRVSRAIERRVQSVLDDLPAEQAQSLRMLLPTLAARLSSQTAGPDGS